jgi:hypothetical protein
MIKSMVIVADGGYVFRIEPTEGITQPTGELDQSKLPPARNGAWEGLIRKNAERAALSDAAEDGVDFLIQDDDWFASALVNVGTFGIVYSVIIEVVPRYYLLETAEITTWEELRRRLLAQSQYLRRNITAVQAGGSELFENLPFTARLPRDPGRDCADVRDGDDVFTVHAIAQTVIEVHPHGYPKADELHICRIVRRYKVPYGTAWAEKAMRMNNGDPRLKKGRRVGEGNPTVLGPLNATAEGVEHDAIRQQDKYEKDILLNAVALLRPASGLRGKSFDLFLHRTKRASAITDSSGEAQSGEVDPVGNVIPPSCSDYYINRNYYTQVLAYFPGYGVELGFPTKSTSGSGGLPAYVAAMDRILVMARQHWETGRYIQTSPIALRMVKASNAFLSMQYSGEDEPTCMIELLNQIDTHGGKELFYRYESELFRYGARPHWGLDLSVTTGNNGLVGTMYKRFGEWMQVYGALNYGGRFCNRFTDRMGM